MQCAKVGKWHLGLNKFANNDGLKLPYHRGFDFVGHILPFSNHWACDESGRHSLKPGQDPSVDKKRDRVCFIYRNTTIWQQPIDHSTLTHELLADALGFLDRSVAQSRPFLLYVRGCVRACVGE